MKRIPLLRAAFIELFVLGLCSASPDAIAADWPQFMRGPEHTGDAAFENLRLPLNLATCVKLEDAVTTAPAVVDGKVYVVDQMGTAYCIDPAGNRVHTDEELPFAQSTIPGQPPGAGQIMETKVEQTRMPK